MNLLLFKIATFVTGLTGGSLLGATDYYDEVTEQFTGSLAFLNPIMSALDGILTPLLIFVATAGTIYAVVLGVNMAKAETADKREEAKKRIINAVIALVITIVLILLLGLFKANLGAWIS
ncbi:MAG: hypothetical protein PHC46_00120 [Clostridia bacterium]|nr:hypothetical protein [Clostridia bacterium]